MCAGMGVARWSWVCYFIFDICIAAQGIRCLHIAIEPVTKMADFLILVAILLEVDEYEILLRNNG